MNKLLFVLAAVLCLLMQAPKGSAQTIRLAPLPMVSAAEMFQQFQPFCDYISTVTGQPVELVYHEGYKTLLEQLHSDHVDLAYLGPLPYVILSKRDSGFIPVARFVDEHGAATYTCSLVTFDYAITPQNNKPPRIALTQPYSTCGYLLSQQLLSQYNLKLDQLPYYYSGQHSTCALDVVCAKADLATVKTSIAQHYAKLGLRVTTTSDPLPGFLLVANTRTLSSTTIEQIRTQLLQLDPLHNEVDATTTAPWGEMLRYGAIAASATDYQQIEHMLATTTIPGLEQ